MSDEKSFDDVLGILVAGSTITAEIISPIKGLPTAIGAVAQILGQRYLEARKKRISERLDKFMGPLVEEWPLLGSESGFAEAMALLPLPVMDDLFEDMKAGLESRSSEAAPAAAKLFILERTDRTLGTRRIRWARRLISEVDARAIAGIQEFLAQALGEWPEEIGTAAQFTLRGDLIEFFVLTQAQHNISGMLRIPDAEGTFDLLCQHYFRYEGPVPGYKDTYMLGSTVGLMPMLVCTRENLVFLSTIFEGAGRA